MNSQFPIRICFDLDGPILDVSEKYYRIYYDLLRERRVPPIPKTEYWACKRRSIPEEAILQLSGITGWAEEYHRLRQSRIETSEYLRFDSVWPGVREMLHDLSLQNSLVLVTFRHSPRALEWELKSLGLLPVFREVLFVSAAENVEDRAELKVTIVRERFGATPFSGWFVGDTETDIRAGRSLGLRTAAVTFGIRTVEHLLSQAPDILIQSPEELVAWANAHLMS